jgi:hypothetical protein
MINPEDDKIEEPLPEESPDDLQVKNFHILNQIYSFGMLYQETERIRETEGVLCF